MKYTHKYFMLITHTSQIWYSYSDSMQENHSHSHWIHQHHIHIYYWIILSLTLMIIWSNSLSLLQSYLHSSYPTSFPDPLRHWWPTSTLLIAGHHGGARHWMPFVSIYKDGVIELLGLDTLLGMIEPVAPYSPDVGYGCRPLCGKWCSTPPHKTSA